MKITIRQKAKEIHNKGITLIALVITIIVLLILAGISIAMLTGENGILTKATQAAIQTDVAETKEQIKLEIMGNANENGNYTNANVIEAVKKITEKDVIEKQQMVESKKGNSVDLSDLWIQEQLVTFTIKNGNEGQEGVMQFSVAKGTTWLQFMKNCDEYDWDWTKEGVNAVEFIKAFIRDYEDGDTSESLYNNGSFYSMAIYNNVSGEAVEVKEEIFDGEQYVYIFSPMQNWWS